MAAGRHHGKKISYSSMPEALGQVAAGKMTEGELLEWKQRMSRMRFLQRHVHRQHHGMHD